MMTYPYSTLLPILATFWFVIGFASGQNCIDEVFTPDKFCNNVETWEDFFTLVDGSVKEDVLYLCPFDILKDSDDSPVVIGWSLSIICVSTSDTDGCSIKGDGEIIVIELESNGDTLIQGLTFRDGDDHAIHIKSAETSIDPTHTICYCQFKRIERIQSSRGGALMTQSDSGKVYVISSSFVNNFSSTRGGAIYVRSKEMVITDTNFIENSATEWGGAIFCSADSNLTVQGSTFDKNFGKDDIAILVQPRLGLSVWKDGGENSVSGETCGGFYALADKSCQAFTTTNSNLSPPSVSPTGLPSIAPSAFPTPSPTIRPTIIDLSSMKGLTGIISLFTPSLSPTGMPTHIPTMLPTTTPTSSPTLFPTPTPTYSTTTLSIDKDEEVCLLEKTSDPCIEVATFVDLVNLVSSASQIKLCGGFSLLKLSDQVLELTSSHTIHCVAQCTIYGTGTHIKISGVDTNVAIHNMKFMLSDDSAIRVVTSSSTATTSLCSTEFQRNKGYLGGALFVGSEAGIVNVVDSVFINNEAVKGAALFGSGETVNIVESRFISNVATRAGGALFIFKGSELSLNSTTFALNRVTSSLAISNNYAIVVEAGDDTTPAANATYFDLGDNVLVDSGDCSGFFVKTTKTCSLFV